MIGLTCPPRWRSRYESRAPIFRFPAAHYEASPEDATIDGLNRAVLQYDKSGSSAVNVLYLNGVAGNYGSAPHAANLNMGATFCLISETTPDTWAPSGASAFIGKYTTTGDKREYYMAITAASGLLSVVVSSDGTAGAVTSYVSTATLASAGLTAMNRGAVRCDYSAATITFYTAPNRSGPWTQLGNVLSAGSYPTPAAKDGVLEIGSIVVGTSALSSARHHYHKIIAGTFSGGTTVFEQDFALAPTKLAPSVTASTGQTVTINSVGDLGARIAGARDIAQFTASKMAVYTAPTANNPGYFTKDGGNDYSRSPAFPLTQPILRVSAIRQVTWTSGDYIMDGVGGANTGALVQTTSTPQLNLNAGSSVAGNTTLPVDTDGVVVEVLNGASSSLRVSRGAATTGGAGAGAPNGITLGASGASTAANFANARYMEEIIFQGTQYDAIAQDRIARQFMRKKHIAMAA